MSSQLQHLDQSSDQATVPSGQSTCRILHLDPQVADHIPREGVEDFLETVQADIILIGQNESNHRGSNRATLGRLASAFEGTQIQSGATDRTAIDPETLLISVNHPDDLTGIKPPAPSETLIVHVPSVAVSVDRTTLEAKLEHRDILERFSRHANGDVLFVTPSLEGTYRHHWGDVHLRGMGAIESEGAPRIPVFSIGSGHLNSVGRYPADRFGIQALDGVGPTTAERLAEADLASREAIASAPFDTLTDIKGIGERTATAIRDKATAMVDGTAVIRDELPLSQENVATIRIGTDGPSPSIIWQIGIHFPDRDDSRCFTETDPDDPASIIQAFANWYLANHSDRTLVAWNGWHRAFKHLSRFIGRHAPEQMADWESVPKFDLYHHAVDEGNAVLPGRTNALPRVLDGLGDDPTAILEARELEDRYDSIVTGEAGGDEPIDRLDTAGKRATRAISRVMTAIDSGEPSALSGRSVKDHTTDQFAQHAITDF